MLLRGLRWGFLAVFFAVSHGCGFVDYEDISSHESYRDLIGKRFETKIELIVHGVNMENPIGTEVHQYSVTPRLGFGGREVRSRKMLPLGSVVKVQRILRCTNCYLDFDPRIEIQLSILSSDKYDDHDVLLGANWIDFQLLKDQGSPATLNQEFFAKLN